MSVRMSSPWRARETDTLTRDHLLPIWVGVKNKYYTKAQWAHKQARELGVTPLEKASLEQMMGPGEIVVMTALGPSLWTPAKYETWLTRYAPVTHNAQKAAELFESITGQRDISEPVLGQHSFWEFHLWHSAKRFVQTRHQVAEDLRYEGGKSLSRERLFDLYMGDSRAKYDGIDFAWQLDASHSSPPSFEPAKAIHIARTFAILELIENTVYFGPSSSGRPIHIGSSIGKDAILLIAENPFLFPMIEAFRFRSPEILDNHLIGQSATTGIIYLYQLVKLGNSHTRIIANARQASQAGEVELLFSRQYGGWEKNDPSLMIIESAVKQAVSEVRKGDMNGPSFEMENSGSLVNIRFNDRLSAVEAAMVAWRVLDLIQEPPQPWRPSSRR